MPEIPMASLMTATLRAEPWGEAAAAIMAAALDAVDPGNAVRRWLHVDAEGVRAGDHVLPLAATGRIWLVAVGKASVPMAAAALAILGERVAAGVVITKHGYQDGGAALPRMAIFAAGHPVPDDQSVAAAQAVAELLARAAAQDLVLALISGGGSALMTLPPTGVTLADLQILTADLLASGAAIHEINTLRRHLDGVKGGGLARLAGTARVLTMILSDVVGNPLDAIASGPTVPDASTFADATAILARYRLVYRVPAAISAYLAQGSAGAVPETLKPDDPRCAQITNVIIGDVAQAARAAARRARVLGWHPLILTTYLQGEAREIGRVGAAILRDLAEHGQLVDRPACVILGGETTVTLSGHGRGGRNQELALGAIRDLAGTPRVALIALATDGGDGPTDAAGAVVTGATLARSQALGLRLDDALAAHDAYPFFAALDDLLMPGPTETNVNDLLLLFAW